MKDRASAATAPIVNNIFISQRNDSDFEMQAPVQDELGFLISSARLMAETCGIDKHGGAFGVLRAYSGPDSCST